METMALHNHPPMATLITNLKAAKHMDGIKVVAATDHKEDADTGNKGDGTTESPTPMPSNSI
jgi:hypothetical protein